MSLKEKWEKYRAENDLILAPAEEIRIAKRAFYAGAEAAEDMSIVRNQSLVAEIDAFRSRK